MLRILFIRKGQTLEGRVLPLVNVESLLYSINPAGIVGLIEDKIYREPFPGGPLLMYGSYDVSKKLIYAVPVGICRCVNIAAKLCFMKLIRENRTPDYYVIAGSSNSGQLKQKESSMAKVQVRNGFF
jgi:hypothetical protein